MDKHKKVFTGTVTKFIENFGIIDEDVFFRIEVVEGGSVKINDQVYVECEYSEQLPFKWNATKVKVLSLQRVAPTYLQHRMQQMLQQSIPPVTSNNLVPNQLTNKNSINVQDQTNFFTPEIRNLIEKQQPQNVQNFQNNQSFNRQNDFNNPTSFGQITYTSTPGSAFVSSVLPFNQINVQQPLQLPNIRQFSSNSNTNNFKKDNSRGDERNRDDFKNNRDNRDRLRKDDRDQRHRDIDRDKDRGRDRNNRDRDNRDLREPRDTRDFKDNRDNREINRDNRDNLRDRQKNRRNTDSPVSNTSNNSKPRRRYTPLNIPNNEILKSSLNNFDIKRKFDSAIHVPSDFKELQLNETFELNIKALHKPIQYRINNSSPKEKKNENANEETKLVEDKKEILQNSETEVLEEIKENKIDSEKLEDKSISEENKNKEDLVNLKTDNLISIKNEVKKEKKKEISNKYAVKVLLLSLPSMNDIFDRVFGSDKDNCTTSKAYFLHFNKLISFLCMKNHNDGHSLIGGKFDPKLDGFINENEPNLIQTAIRCVKQQTGIDLSSCKKWKHLCTFLYNRDDSPFYENVPFEYSKIYIPDVWSLLENHEKQNFELVNNCLETKINSEFKNDEKNTSSLSNDQSFLNNSSSDFKEEKTSELDSNDGLHQVNNSNGNTFKDNSLNLTDSSNLDDNKLNSSISNSENLNQKDISEKNNKLSIESFDIDHLNDLKVTTLRAHLDELGIKVVKNMKKADLIQKLATYIKDQQEINLKLNNPLETSTDELKDDIIEDNTDKLVELNSEPKNNSINDHPSSEAIDDSSFKRKLEEDTSEVDSSIEQNKKLKSESCHDETSSTEKDFKIDFEKSEISKDGFIMAYSNNSISVLSLFQALSHNKYDHFELQIIAQILKEALIDHFCNYILSACFENKNLIKEQEEKKEDIKETIENNYILLAFSYFDSCHCGYMLADDLLRLFNNCKINLSKRTWSNIFGSHERIKYRNLKDPLKIYNFRKIFENQSNKSTKNNLTTSLFVKNGNVYDVDKLISQSEIDEKFKVELKDKLKISEELIRSLQESLNELDSKQKKMSMALKKQNDEICDLKREKEKTKVKYSEALKLITTTIDNFTEFSKKQEEKQDKTKEIKSTTLAI